MNIGSIVDFPGRKPYCVLSIDVICRNLASINRSHGFIEWHINLMPGSYCTLVYLLFLCISAPSCFSSIFMGFLVVVLGPWPLPHT